MTHAHPASLDRTSTAAATDTPDAAHGRYRVWAVDPEHYSTHRVCALRHTFHEHPLMQLPRLAELAKALWPTRQCRFIKPGATQKSEFQHADAAHDGRTIDDVFARIQEPGSWVALYNVETDPTYRGFLDDVTASVRHLVDPEQPGMFNVGGFIFISAPPSVTPFHIDRENNFWLQVSGRKTMNVWENSDRMTVPGPVVEEFIVNRTLEHVRLDEALVGRSHEFDTGPGDGVYFPSTSPHMTRSDPGWTRPGDGVSISIGVVFYTDVTRRHANIHACNRVLRRLGLSPRSPGDSPFDAVKYACGRAVVYGMRTMRGYQPSVGL